MSQLDRSRVFYLALCIVFALGIVGTMNLDASGRNLSGEPPRSRTTLDTSVDVGEYVVSEAGNFSEPTPAIADPSETAQSRRDGRR